MGALDGVRVIDFGQYIAGPMTGMLLVDQGAEVIKVDPPGGPVWDAAANATWNRGKRSILLDLKAEDDLETARRLIGSADVVVENFRPGVMDRLGLGAAAMTAADPRLVYASLPGFASDDPRRDVAAWEGVVGASTATYFARGVFQMEDSPRPVYTAVPIASTYAALQAATAIAAALVARERDGRNSSMLGGRDRRSRCRCSTGCSARWGIEASTRCRCAGSPGCGRRSTCAGTGAGCSSTRETRTCRSS